MGTSSNTRLPMEFSFLVRSPSISSSCFSASSIFSLTALACAFSSSHASYPLDSFIFWATAFDMMPSSFLRLSTSYLTIFVRNCAIWHTLSPPVIDLDDLVNNGVVTEAGALGSLHLLWVTSYKNLLIIYCKRETELCTGVLRRGNLPFSTLRRLISIGMFADTQ